MKGEQMIPLDLENWHVWLKSESWAIRGLRSKIHSEKRGDMIYRCYLDGYFAHYKLACKQFAEQVRMKRYFKVGQN